MIKDHLYTALITPFKNQEVDYSSLSHLIERQLKAKVDGLLILGTTAEASTLSETEKEKILAHASRQIQGKIQLMVGVGTNSTKTTIENALKAQSYHASQLSIITPYYNKPTQAGIYEHFKMIAQNVSLPIMLYNHPGRCGQNIHLDTLKALAQISNIIGIKDSFGQLDYIQEISYELPRIRSDFKIYCGDDIHLLPYASLGAYGVVSVASNLIPKIMKQFMEHLINKKFDQAKEDHRKLYLLFKGLSLETNPIPIKAALHLCNIASDQMRLPLTQMQKNHLNVLEDILIQTEMIHGEVKPQSFEATV